MNGKSIVLIDTPGFDDTEKPDSKILKLIAENIVATARLCNDQRIALILSQ
jgi:predicted GTPase